jgi:hypothetical protein
MSPFRLLMPTNLARRGAPSGCDPDCGAGCGACARSRKPLPGGSGHHALRYYGRGGRCCPCSGLASRRVTPAVRTSHEAWPGAECGCRSPHESRSGAPEGERAPQADALRKGSAVCGALRRERKRAALPPVCTADMVGCVFRRSAPLAVFARAALVLELAWWSQTSDAFGAARTILFVMANATIQFRGAVLDCCVASLLAITRKLAPGKSVPGTVRFAAPRHGPPGQAR